MNIPSLSQKHIAITGFSRSGKTALMSALLWNMQYQMDKQKELRPFKVLRDYDDMRPLSNTDSWLLSRLSNRAPIERFDLNGSILSFKQGKFPRKTHLCESYSLSLIKDYGRYLPSVSTDCLFFDFPGERIEDSTICKHEHYSDWATDMLKLLNGSEYEKCRHLSEDYRILIKDKSTPPETLLQTYKELLINFSRHGLPTSPSSFRLSAEGVRTTLKNVEQACCGLSPEKQFCPLPEEWEGSELYQRMSQHYKEYREQLTEPIFNMIRQADVLLVLLDISDILRKGYESYRYHLSLLDKLAKLCQSNPLLNPFGLGLGIKKVAFIATQSDRVLKSDLPALDELLKELTASARGELKGLGFRAKDIACFSCSACSSTEAAQDGKIFFRHAGENYEFSRDKLPEYWPTSNWQPDKKTPYPDPPPIKGNTPPNSVNLDSILEFILN